MGRLRPQPAWSSGLLVYWVTVLRAYIDTNLRPICGVVGEQGSKRTSLSSRVKSLTTKPRIMKDARRVTIGWARKIADPIGQQQYFERAP